MAASRFGAPYSTRRTVWVSCIGLIFFAVLGFATHHFADTVGVGILIVGINALVSTGQKPENE